MRCSLLTLSSYIDGELAPERAGELEAHVIACQRCSAGLGYLREEAERIHGLAPVRALPDAAERLLVEVGLVARPGVAEPPPEAPLPLYVPPPASGHELEFEPLLEPTLELPARVQRPANGTGGRVSIPTAPALGEEIAAQVAPVVDEPVAEAETPAEVPATPPPDHATSMPIAASPAFMERIRDAIAVRLALRRGAVVADDVDDGVQIVSGTGAPGWGGRRAQELQRERRERSAAAAVPAAALDFGGGARDPEPASPEPQPPESAHTQVPAPREEPPPERPHVRPQLPEWYVPPPAPEPIAAPAPDERPGRHLRALQSGRAGAARTLAGIRAWGAGRGRPAGTARAINDRRLWVFGAAVAVLLIIGLIVGKSVTQTTPIAIAPGAVPNPTAIALTPSAQPATAAPTAAATAQPTATPRPTPQPAANPLQLSGAQTLGDRGTGWHVEDLRYGAHPNDFRIVYDLTGGAGGNPRATVGYGNATTLYVELSGVTGGTAPQQPPAGNVVTSVKLLQPSPVSGKTVYEITLTHQAGLSTIFLAGPTRLVIDLS